MGTKNTIHEAGRSDPVVPDQCLFHIEAELCAKSMSEHIPQLTGNVEKFITCRKRQPIAHGHSGDLNGWPPH